MQLHYPQLAITLIVMAVVLWLGYRYNPWRRL